MNDAQEEELKKRFRAFQRRAAQVVFAAAAAVGILLYAIQAVLSSGVTLASYWGPLGVLAVLTMGFLVRKKWGLAVICGLVMVFSAYYLRQVDRVRRMRKSPTARCVPAPAVRASRAISA